MDVMFRDKILTCANCGNQFVYTVGQQRMALDEYGESRDPDYCPLCEVKMARGVRERPTPAVRTIEWSAQRDSEQPTPPPWPFPSRDEQPATPSPNRPPDYRSGEEHPLHGHGGEPQEGVVKWFNDRKGFGFITLDTGVELFVHYSGIVSEGYRTLKQGQRVSLVVEDTGKGPQASNVTLLREASDALTEADVESESESAPDISVDA